jgi:iron-sulfur cluster protein
MEREGENIGRNARTINQLSEFAIQQFDSYEDCRDAAREIKEGAIENLPALIDAVEQSVNDNGGEVHLAQSAADANRIIEGILDDRDAQRLVKSKSMTTEEIAVNDHLESAGYDVVETDLGEFVIQLAEETPSHLVGPAMHKSPEQIATLFNHEFGLTGEDELTANPQELTAFAREQVGASIREADAGMTGANFVVAESGTILLVTNEGNARKTAVTPETHIAVAGVEKLVPTLADLQPFTELIARTGTGQDITSYMSLLTPPVETPIPDFETDEFRDGSEREFHLVLLDNGRMAMREDDQLRETLYCIRCGACSNSCSNFQAVGGHAFGGETYTGGIGTGWEAGVHGLDSASDMNDLCTGCSRCVPKCPVKIDIPWINTVVRDRLNREEKPDTVEFLVDGLTPDTAADEPAGLDRQKWLFANVETLAKVGSVTPNIANAIAGSRPGKWVLAELFGVDPRRDLPTLADETLREWYGERGPDVNAPDRDVVLYPDLYTDYFDPERGKAAIRALESLGVRVHVPPVPESGRAPLSQGLISTARERAETVHGRLVTHIDQGRDVVVVEPSDLAMVRDEYEKLLPARSFERLSEHTYGVMEYVYGLLENGAEPDELAPPDGASVAVHSHCQERTLGLDEYTVAVLEQVGYEVRTSDVECCGMAGSFGYKREYFEVSEAVGEQLKEDLGEVDGERLVASGTSCGEQLTALYNRPAVHPVELIGSD